MGVSPSTLNLLALIKAGKAFHGLSEANRKYLAEHAVINSYKRGDSLWKRNSPCEFCAFILHGIVEVVNTSKHGVENIVGIFGPEDLIGISAIVRKITYPADATIASKTCTVMKLYIRSNDVELKESEHINMLTWQRERILTHEQILREKISIIGAGNVHSRLVEFFSYLQMRFGRTQEAKIKTYIIPFGLTKTQIAKIIEARVETVIRILNKWEKAGYLEMDDETVLLRKMDELKHTDRLP